MIIFSHCILDYESHVILINLTVEYRFGLIWGCSYNKPWWNEKEKESVEDAKINRGQWYGLIQGVGLLPSIPLVPSRCVLKPVHHRPQTGSRSISK